MALIDNLIEYWKMENTSGELWAYNLTATWTPASVSWKILNARQYTAWSNKDKYLHTSAIPAWTASFWINLTNTSGAWARCWSKTQSWVSDVFVLRAYAAWLSVQIFDSANLNTSWATISASTWYHYVVTWDWSNVITYRNWSAETTTSSTKTVQANTRWYFFWWTDVNSEWINWTMDEIWFWSRALSSTEVTDLYNWWTWLTYPFTTSTFIPRIIIF